jgi:WD40 repeat protein
VEIIVLKGNEGQGVGAAFRPDGRFLVTASYDYTARLWNTWIGKALTFMRGQW